MIRGILSFWDAVLFESDGGNGGGGGGNTPSGTAASGSSTNSGGLSSGKSGPSGLAAAASKGVGSASPAASTPSAAAASRGTNTASAPMTAAPTVTQDGRAVASRGAATASQAFSGPPMGSLGGRTTPANVGQISVATPSRSAQVAGPPMGAVGGRDPGAGYSVSPTASAAPAGFGQATSKGGSIASVGLSGAFSPQVGLGNSMGVTSARGMSYNKVPSSMIGGWNTPANNPAFSARAAAMNMDTPQRTASVSGVGAAMAPVGSVVAGRSSFDALSGQSTARSAQPMSFVEMQRMAQEAQNRSMVENPYMAVAGPITADKVRAVDAALATIAKEVRGLPDPFNAVVRGKTPPSPITGMTIRDAATYANKNGAIGFAQFTQTHPTKGTLTSIATKMGFDLDKTVMTPAVQQALAMGLVQQRANQATRNGKIDPVEFGHALAQEWAAFESPKTGKGVYDGDKHGNKAYVPASEVLGVAQGMIDSGAVAAGRSFSEISKSLSEPSFGLSPTPASAGRAAVSQGPAAAQNFPAWPSDSKTDNQVRAERDVQDGAISVGDVVTQEQVDANPPNNGLAFEPNMNANGLPDGTYTVVADPSIPGGSTMQHQAMRAIGGLGSFFAGIGVGASPSGNFVQVSEGDGEGRERGQGQEEPLPTQDPPPAPPPVVNVVEASRRFVDDYLYPTPPVKWPARQLTFQR